MAKKQKIKLTRKQKLEARDITTEYLHSNPDASYNEVKQVLTEKMTSLASEDLESKKLEIQVLSRALAGIFTQQRINLKLEKAQSKITRKEPEPKDEDEEQDNDEDNTGEDTGDGEESGDTTSQVDLQHDLTGQHEERPNLEHTDDMSTTKNKKVKKTDNKLDRSDIEVKNREKARKEAEKRANKLISPAGSQTDTNPASDLPEKPPRVVSKQLQTFQMLEEGHGSVEVMEVVELEFNEFHKYLIQFNQLKDEQAKRDKFSTEKYLGAFFQFAKIVGDPVRGGCQYFTDETGLCKLWELREIDPVFRKAYPGCFQSTEGGKTRFKVQGHPEICALCHRGTCLLG